MDEPLQNIRLGTRGSLLAKMQSQGVADALEAGHPGLRVELVIIKTTGDRIQDQSLADIGGKGLFTKELQLALLNNEIDFAVHSYKDVPVTMPLIDQSALMIAAVTDREDPCDVMVSLKNYPTIHDLPQGAKVGTSSLRRRAQLLDKRPDLDVQPLRGNIDTRIRKLRDGDYEAILLAYAGVRRAGLFDGEIMKELSIEEMLPAAGQGALALECRANDTRVIEILTTLNNPIVRNCVNLEREIVLQLNGDCHSPIGALMTYDESSKAYTLRAITAGADGAPPVKRVEATSTDLNLITHLVMNRI